MRGSPLFVELGTFPGYRQGELVCEGDQCRVVTAIRLADDLPVVLKILHADEGNERAVLERARHELELTRRSAGPGVVRALALEQAGSEIALVLERVNGQTLRDRIAARPLPLPDFFALALPLARAVAQVHAARIIHRDLKPDNVLVDERDNPTLIDFGIATVLPRGQDELREPGVLQGSLPYLAPEQSGRMNRGVDMRTDLYALGITFYEMLAGRPPWEGDDPLELVHAHLTRPPPPLAELRGADDLPEPLIRIVGRLLAKEPDERYQSARGLVVDLQRCAEMSAGAGQGAANPAFTLSAALPDHLRFSGHLHGRAPVGRALEEAFSETTAGMPLLVLVTGATGMGKTAHADSLRPLVLEAGGLWAAGRFRKERRNEPYSGLREALGAVCNRLLGASEDELQEWRERLRQALGPIAAVVVEIVPELERLIGAPEPVASLGPAETRNRFLLAMRRLLTVLATPESPLVLCLDDIEHADAGSLHLLEALLSGPSPQWLLLMATVDEASAADSPLQPLIKEAAERDRLRQVIIPPLSAREMTDWLAELLGLPPGEVEGLASVVGRKTGDNPLFTQQFLHQLEESRLLRLDAAGKWIWDEAAVAGAEVPDDLAGVMRDKLQAVSAPAQRVAAWASAIGSSFTLTDLHGLNNPSEARNLDRAAGPDVAAALLELSEAGLLARNEHSYRFAHTSLQQAAADSLSADETRDLHAQLGWSLLGKSDPSAGEPRGLFEIARHFQAAYSPSADQGEADGLDGLSLERRRQVVAVLRRAGERALNATAHEAAIGHLEAAARAADPGLPRDRPGEAFAIELGLAKALFLAGRREQSDAAFAALVERRLPPRLTAEARSAQVALLTYAGEVTRAVAAGRQGLLELGLRFPEKPSKLSLLPRLAGVLLALRRRSDQELLAGRRTDDEKVEAAVMLIDAVGPAAYWTDSRLYAAMHLCNMRLQLRRGYTASVSYAFARQALLAGGLLGDVQAAVRMGRLAAEVEQVIPCPQYGARIRTLMLMTVEAWVRPLSAIVAELPAASRACEEAGDLEYANYSASLRMGLALASGMNLVTWKSELAETTRRCSQWGFREVASVEEQSLALIELLLGERAFDESDPVSRRQLQSRESKAPLYLHATRGLLVLYLLGRVEDCFRLAEETADFTKALPGQSLVLEHHFWHGMAAAALAAQPDPQRRQLLGVLKRLIRTLARHAQSCPENNLHRLHLLRAEHSRLRGKHQEALEQYALATEHAGRHQVTHLQALAHERRASLLAQLGRQGESDIFLFQAHDGYRSWGSRRKCELLEAAHPGLARRTEQRSGDRGNGRRLPSGSPLRTGAQPAVQTSNFRSAAEGRTQKAGRANETTNNRVDARWLDMTTLLGASQAISEELTVDGVLRRLLTAALTNAGAERGVLVLHREGVAMVEAESTASGGFSRLNVPLDSFPRIPVSALRLVERTGERLVLGNASQQDPHAQDPWVRQARVRSVLTAPIVRQGVVVGLIYLENNVIADAFTPDRVELLQLLATQAAISLDNAQLYSSLEAKVQSRTRQLDARNRQLRLVLDNVEQGFLTLNRDGIITGERSAVVERWLGTIGEGVSLADYILRVDPGAGKLMRLGWEALLEDILPFEILIDQLPRRLTLGEGQRRRVLELAFRPIYDEGGAADPAAFSQMLVVISDVTAALARQISERSQRELVEIFQRIVRDRPGVEEFRAEASLLVAHMTGRFSTPLAELKRSLHTLKGNAGIFGLGSLADLCGAAEEDVEDAGEAPPPERMEEIRNRWQEIDSTLATFLGTGPRETVELRPSEVEELTMAISQGAPPEVLTAMVRGWSRESMVDRLGRIADQVRRLGRLAGKGELTVFTEPNDLRLDADAWASFWSALVHVLRNAVDHGLEAPDERLRAGKLHPPTMVVRTFMADENLVIEVSDDGRGVAWEKIAAKAREAGLPAETQEHLVAALFSDGLSTQDEATEMSGRGVGAGAVRAECEARGGHVQVRSEPGRGTTFSFIFPLAEAQRRGVLSEALPPA